MGRPKGEPTKVMRIPVSRVDEVLALLGRPPKIQPEPGTLMEVLLSQPEPARRRVARVVRNPTPPMVHKSPPHGSWEMIESGCSCPLCTPATTTSAVASVQCPQCLMFVPDSRYRGRRHKSGCSKFSMANP